ncbi:MAG: TrkA family potassium uptake protein [Candidatus Auribacterota bacterium]|jgi:trk system potassium uptake protein TrkA
MKQFVVIGLGSFGETIAKALYDLGCQVLAIDYNKDRVQAVKDEVSQALVMDVRDREAISSLPIQSSDLAVISLGDEMEVSILATLYLREMGLNNIMVKAVSEDHGKILKLIGASEIIFPEKQMAMRLAERLAYPSLLDFVTLADGFSMAELLPMESFYGKNLIQLDIRRKFNLEIVAIKHTVTEKDGSKSEKIKCIPSADYTIAHGDILLIIGEDKYIEKYRKM